MARPKPHEVLREAIDAARVALRELDDDEVPARVRRVRSFSGGTLPPPLAASLVRELGSDDFLRGKALEAWDAERPPGGGSALASFAFLSREPGWERTVVEEALAMGERRGIAVDRQAELERETLAAEVASLREQVRRERDEAAARERELRAALEAERAPGRVERQSEQKAIDRLEEERRAWLVRQGALEARIAELDEEVRSLKEVARRARADRAELAVALESVERSGMPTDPVELARLADDLASHAIAIAPAPDAFRPEGSSSIEPQLAPYDPSIAPDRAEAIDWLVGAGDATVLVDGYNLGFALAGLEIPRARALAVEAATRLAVASPRSDVIVVFDSSVDPLDDRTVDAGRDGPVSVVFTSGEPADDAIVDRACAGHPAVVITNDRDLRQRSERCGAVTLWSDAMVEWSRRR